MLKLTKLNQELIVDYQVCNDCERNSRMWVNPSNCSLDEWIKEILTLKYDKIGYIFDLDFLKQLYNKHKDLYC